MDEIVTFWSLFIQSRVAIPYSEGIEFGSLHMSRYTNSNPYKILLISTILGVQNGSFFPTKTYS